MGEVAAGAGPTPSTSDVSVSTVYTVCAFSIRANVLAGSKLQTQCQSMHYSRRTIWRSRDMAEVCEQMHSHGSKPGVSPMTHTRVK